MLGLVRRATCSSLQETICGVYDGALILEILGFLNGENCRFFGIESLI
jgi:hypothetical protein